MPVHLSVLIPCDQALFWKVSIFPQQSHLRNAFSHSAHQIISSKQISPAYTWIITLKKAISGPPTNPPKPKHIYVHL